MQDKQIKIGAVALVIALLALSQATAISSLYNYHFFNGTNISIIDDGFGNITISTNASGVSDDTKINKSGDTVNGVFTTTQGYKIGRLSLFNGFATFSSKYLDKSSSIESDSGTIFMTSEDTTNFNGMFVTPTSSAFYNTINMQGNNINNCGNCITDSNLNSSIDKNLSNYTNNYNWINNSTMAADNSKVNKSGDNITGKVNILNGGKLSIGEPFSTTTGIDDFQVSRYNQNGVTMGFDLSNINASGNSRAIFRVSAGNLSDLTGNPNLPFTVFSNTYSGSPSLVRATAYNALEYRVGIGSTPPTATNGTQANYTIYTGVSLSGVSTVSERLRLDGYGNLYLSGLSGSGNDYACLDSTGKLFRSDTAC